MPVHVSSTMCSSSGGENCIMQPVASGIITPIGGRPVHSAPLHVITCL